MITLSYTDLSNPNFSSAVRKMAQSSGYKCHKTAYNVAKICKALEEEYRIFEEQRSKLSKRFMGDSQMPTLMTEEMKLEAKKFGEVTFDVNRPKLTLDDLEAVGLSPNEWLALEGLLEPSSD